MKAIYLILAINSYMHTSINNEVTVKQWTAYHQGERLNYLQDQHEWLLMDYNDALCSNRTFVDNKALKEINRLEKKINKQLNK